MAFDPYTQVKEIRIALDGSVEEHVAPAPDGYVFQEDTLERKRDVKMVEIKAARDEALKSFAWDGSTFDSDDTAQIRLLGLLTASKEPDFTSEWWRLSNNSWRELAAADVAGVWAALKDNIRYCFQRFAYLEAQVAEATAEQLAEITWAEPNS